MQLLTSISLDFGNNSYTPTVYAKRRDSKSRYIAITPYNNGEDLELTDGITARIHLTKPDGHTVFNDCIISDNEIRVELTAQILSVEGLAVAEIGLYEGEALLSSQNFFINIDASAFDENAPESSDEFNALIDALASVKNSAEIAENAAEAAQEAVSTAERAAENSTAAANAASNAASKAATATGEAISATNAANGAAESANNAANSASSASARAETAAERAENIAELIEESTIKRYGCRRLIESSDPVCERIWNAVGLNAAVGVDAETVSNDFDNIFPWSHIRTCNIEVINGEIIVKAYEGEAGFARDGSNGEVAVEIPKFYQAPRLPGDGYEYFGVCDLPLGGWTLNPRFITSDGVELDKIYLSAYEAYYNEADETKTDASGAEFTLKAGLHSVSGVIPTTAQTRGTFRTQARATSEACGLYDLASYDVITTLFTVEFATLDSQSIMCGYTKGKGTTPAITGLTDGVAASSGSPSSNSDGLNCCKYRGIENPYGGVMTFVDGVNILDRVPWVSSNPADYADELHAAPYYELNYVGSTTGSYIKQFGLDNRYPWARFPIAGGGSSATYYCDVLNASTGARVLCVGGNWQQTTASGLWCFNANFQPAPTSVPYNVGARLSCFVYMCVAIPAAWRK